MVVAWDGVVYRCIRKPGVSSIGAALSMYGTFADFANERA